MPLFGRLNHYQLQDETLRNLHIVATDSIRNYIPIRIIQNNHKSLCELKHLHLIKYEFI